MKAKLIVVGGKANSTEIDLKLPAIIGRGRNAAVVLPHPLVSREHCEIFELNGKLAVRDLKSLNGTFIGNQRITESALNPGELLIVGAVTFRAVYGDLTASSPEKPIEPLTNTSGDTVSNPASLEESISEGLRQNADPKNEAPEFVAPPELSEPLEDTSGIDPENSPENLASVHEEIEASGYSQVLSSSIEREEDSTASSISSSASDDRQSFPPLEEQDEQTNSEAEKISDDDDGLNSFLKKLK